MQNTSGCVTLESFPNSVLLKIANKFTDVKDLQNVCFLYIANCLFFCLKFLILNSKFHSIIKDKSFSDIVRKCLFIIFYTLSNYYFF